jgi:cytochrome c-type biogenesis protein CcmH/NrfG
MPDLGAWALLVALGSVVAVAVGWPLIRPAPPSDPGQLSRDASEGHALRHRLALDALLDIEADRRAGSLDDASYERQRGEAEALAAASLTEPDEDMGTATGPVTRGGRRPAAWLAIVLAAALAVAFALPAPIGLGERTVVNQALAHSIAREAARQADIQRLLGLLQATPEDPKVLSDLADAYLAGSSAQDLQRAAVALQVLLAVDPQNRSAYRRLITAYISASDWADATSATDSYARIVSANEPDIPFFRGLIAFRSGQASAAVEQFDRFLRLAPHDARASMVLSLRAEAAGELPGGSTPESAAPGG